MTRFRRADRVEGQVKKELSDLLKKEVRDPRLDSVAIVDVAMSDDLRSARVYFSAARGEQIKADALAGFKSALGFLRRKLSARLGLRYMPELRFFHDESFDRGTRLDEILKTIHEETGTVENE
jgi:ribosome-binding factor A